MKPHDTKRTLAICMLMGGLWGILEATLGHALHLAGSISFFPGLAGSVMFPIGFYFMYEAYRQSGSLSAVMGTATVAAGIKLADLIIPSTPLSMAVHPAISILVEGLAVAALLKITDVREGRLMIPHGIAASTAWRLAFAGIIFGLGIDGGIAGWGGPKIARFILVGGLVSGVLVGVMLRLLRPAAGRRLAKLAADYPAAAAVIAACAVLAELARALA
jgi:hypothetical protein